MISPDEISLTVDAACQLLRQSNCLNQASSHQGFDQPPSSIDRASLQRALQVVAAASDYQILGICAGSQAEAVRALNSYATALGYGQGDWSPVERAVMDGAVYIKFNPNTGLCYADAYTGNYRGVLVSCQSAEATDVNEMFGHLPLDLFEP